MHIAIFSLNTLIKNEYFIYHNKLYNNNFKASIEIAMICAYIISDKWVIQLIFNDLDSLALTSLSENDKIIGDKCFNAHYFVVFNFL